MTISSFKVGDRVVLARPDILDHMNGLKKGMTGTVRRVGAPFRSDAFYDRFVLVKFDNYELGTGGGFSGDSTPSHRNIEISQLDLEG